MGFQFSRIHPDCPARKQHEKWQWKDSLVGAVDILDSQDGQVAIISEIAQGNPRSRL